MTLSDRIAAARMAADPSYRPCQWLARCTNPAVTVRDYRPDWSDTATRWEVCADHAGDGWVAAARRRTLPARVARETDR